MAETIENNIRKVIIDEQAVNPIYYEEMSERLNALIRERRENSIEYQQYLERVKELARQVKQPGGEEGTRYPASLNTPAKRNIYDNIGKNEELSWPCA